MLNKISRIVKYVEASNRLDIVFDGIFDDRKFIDYIESEGLNPPLAMSRYSYYSELIHLYFHNNVDAMAFKLRFE